MALLNILEYPDPRLKKVAAPVTAFTPEIEKLVRDMAETMYAAPGVGLAATQVDVHKRVIVIDISESKDELRVFINPELLAAEGEAECEEGCLSVPGYYDKVTRAARITVRAFNERGEPYTLDADGLLAVCVQHEMDHLEGKVFVEKLSPLKRARLLAKLRKKQKLAS
jgi:peptide deformylase